MKMRVVIEEVAHADSRRSSVPLSVSVATLQDAQAIAARLATTTRTVLRIYRPDGHLLSTRTQGEWHV